jgi:hypothetical protein
MSRRRRGAPCLVSDHRTEEGALASTTVIGFPGRPLFSIVYFTIISKL